MLLPRQVGGPACGLTRAIRYAQRCVLGSALKAWRQYAHVRASLGGALSRWRVHAHVRSRCLTPSQLSRAAASRNIHRMARASSLRGSWRKLAKHSLVGQLRLHPLSRALHAWRLSAKKVAAP